MLALSPDDSRLLTLYFTGGQPALDVALNPSEAPAFLAQPHITEVLDLRDWAERRSSRFANIRQRRVALDALEQSLRGATTSAERLHAAVTLIRLSQVPWETPDTSPRRTAPQASSDHPAPGTASPLCFPFLATPAPGTHVAHRPVTRDGSLSDTENVALRYDAPRVPTPINHSAMDTRPLSPPIAPLAPAPASRRPRAAIGGSVAAHTDRPPAPDSPPNDRSTLDAPTRTASLLAAAGAPRARDRP